MGEVYLAERAGEDDPSCKQLAAIKLIKSSADLDRLRKRFKAERRIVAGLNHPSIARLLESGVLEDGTPYFALDYVEGKAIDEYCKRVAVEKRLQIFCKVCEAVAYAHKNLVVHCDLKPSNILVSSDGIPHLLDFGVARLLAEAGENGYHTQTVWPCSPRYSSPEQIRDEAVTTGTDIFALGIILCELVSGTHPFDPQGMGKGFEVIERICRDEPRIRVKQMILDSRRRWQARQFGAELALIIRRALNHRPEDRYANVESLTDDVQRCLDRRPISIKGRESLYRVQKLIQRHPGTTTASVVATLMGIAAIFLTLWLGRVAQRETKYAQEQREFADELANSGSLDHNAGGIRGEEIPGRISQQIWDYDSEAPTVSSSANYVTAKEVVMTLERMVERWNARDIEGFLDFCWRSPQFVLVDNGKIVCGWQALYETYRRAYGNSEMGHGSIRRIKVRLLGPETAYVVHCWSIATSKGVYLGVETNYLQRIDGTWKITIAHSTDGKL